MTRNEIMESIALKKRFCKDYNLPIVVFDNPYFYERLQTIDGLFDCIAKFNWFCSELSVFETEQDYFEYYNKTKDTIINYIQSKPLYTAFINENFQTNSVIPKRNVYVETNCSGTFVSIDMKKANFSAMKHYASNIFDDAETWEEFMNKFTNSQHIINSKYIRQVIMGACNPKKQIRYEHYLMNILCDHIINEIPNISVFSLGEDEIIISMDNGPKFSISKLEKVINNCPFGIGKLVRMKVFNLYKLEGTDGYVKSYYGNPSEIEFKCLNAEIFHQIVKYYLNKPITENDLVFYHDGKLARFLEPIKNPWD